MCVCVCVCVCVCITIHVCVYTKRVGCVPLLRGTTCGWSQPPGTLPKRPRRATHSTCTLKARAVLSSTQKVIGPCTRQPGRAQVSPCSRTWHPHPYTCLEASTAGTPTQILSYSQAPWAHWAPCGELQHAPRAKRQVPHQKVPAVRSRR